MSAGITRITIQSPWRSDRLQMAQDLAPVADSIYRAEFERLGMQLQPGTEIVRCSKAEAVARYDYQEGIDVLLRFADGTRGTLQEKFLKHPWSTVTFEERKASGERGAWYSCSAQYYFVGYARRYAYGVLEFQDYMMLDFPAVGRASRQGQIPWQFNQGKQPGHHESFRYCLFRDVPEHCVVFRSNHR